MKKLDSKKGDLVETSHRRSFSREVDTRDWSCKLCTIFKVKKIQNQIIVQKLYPRDIRKVCRKKSEFTFKENETMKKLNVSSS